MDFDQLLSMLMAPGPVPVGKITVLKLSKPESSVSDVFKKFVLKYVKGHDKLKSSHPVLKQINNATSIEQIETYLRDLDYCEDCFLKMYRKFVSSGHTP